MERRQPIERKPNGKGREREKERKKGKEHVIGWGDLEEWTELAKPLQDKSCDWDQVFWAGLVP